MNANIDPKVVKVVGGCALGAIVIAGLVSLNEASNDSSSSPTTTYGSSASYNSLDGYPSYERYYLQEVMALPGVSSDPEDSLGVGYAACEFFDTGASYASAQIIIMNEIPDHLGLSYSERTEVADTILISAVDYLC